MQIAASKLLAKSEESQKAPCVKNESCYYNAGNYAANIAF